MLRRALICLSIVFLFSSSLFAGENKPSSIEWEKDLEKAQVSMQKTDRPMLLLLTTPGCSYCDRMKAETFAQEWIVEEVGRKYLPVQLDGRQHKELVKRLQVRVYPTTVIVHSSGNVVEVLHGYRSPAAFIRHMAVAKVKLDNQNKLLAAKTTRELK